MAEGAHWIDYVRGRLRLPALSAEREAEIVEEIARQLDDAYRDAAAAGATEAEARIRAEQHVTDWDALARQLSYSTRQRRDGLERWAERMDDRSIAAHGRLSAVASFRQDLVYGLRVLRRTPVVSVVAILSLALGMGANTAAFSVIHALLFRPLAVPRAEQLVSLTDPLAEGVSQGLENGERTLLSYQEFTSLRDTDQVFDGLVAFSAVNLSAPIDNGDPQNARRANVSLVSGNYFPTLEVAPLLGRAFGPEVDAARMAHPVVVLSHAFWREQMQGDPGIIGRTLPIRNTTFTVLGVMPPGFQGLVVGDPPDLWTPVTMQEAVVPGRDWLTQPPGVARRTMFLHVVGRLKAGASLEQASAATNAVFKRALEAEAAGIADPDRRRELVDARLVIREARHGLSSLRGEYKEPLSVLMALVGLLLLLTCANVANLLLARSAGRSREIAMRVALGAGRGRVVRQLLTEGLLLAVLGGTCGLAVAYGGTRVLLWLASGGAGPIPIDARLDGPVLAFTGGIAVITGLLFSLAPALRATRLDLQAVLRGSTPLPGGGERRLGGWSTGQMLAGVQVALSLVLLIAAGLFVRSLERLGGVPLGYEADHLLLFRVDPSVAGYPKGAIEPLFDELLARLRAAPGVAAVTYSSNGLFYGQDIGTQISLPGSPQPEGRNMDSRFDLVGPAYFATLGIPVLSGRDVQAEDARGGPGTWINQAAVRRFFPDRNPLGQRMVAHFSFGNVEYEIRGVVADSRGHSLRDEVGPRCYLAYFTSGIPAGDAVFEVRTVGEAAALAPVVRSVLRENGPRLTPPVFHTVPELLAERLGRDRVTARLSTLFGLMALVLAAVGLYGGLSYGVSRRVSEIGVRLALGARPISIVNLIARDALRVVGLGAAVGLAGAFFATRLVGSMLYGLGPRDPVTFAGAVGVLLLVAIIAAAVPAFRAASTDPLVALRRD